MLLLVNPHGKRTWNYLSVERSYIEYERSYLSNVLIFKRNNGYKMELEMLMTGGWQNRPF